MIRYAQKTCCTQASDKYWIGYIVHILNGNKPNFLGLDRLYLKLQELAKMMYLFGQYWPDKHKY